LRWITDSYRRAPSKAPKEADGDKSAFAVLIFHTVLKKRCEFAKE